MTQGEVSLEEAKQANEWAKERKRLNTAFKIEQKNKLLKHQANIEIVLKKPKGFSRSTLYYYKERKEQIKVLLKDEY